MAKRSYVHALVGASPNWRRYVCNRPIQMPMIRRTFPPLFTNALTGVQPVTQPQGLAFAMRYVYGKPTPFQEWMEKHYKTVDFKDVAAFEKADEKWMNEHPELVAKISECSKQYHAEQFRKAAGIIKIKEPKSWENKQPWLKKKKYGKKIH